MTDFGMRGGVSAAPDAPQYLRRSEAAEYLRKRYGFGATRTLAGLAWKGGGPKFSKAGARVVLYRPEDLDAWAQTLISEQTP